MLDPCAPNPNYQNYKYDGSSFLPMICDLEMFEVGPGRPEVGEGPDLALAWSAPSHQVAWPPQNELTILPISTL